MPQYFTEKTDEYIKKYIESSSDEERHQLFEEGIRKPFEKLIENIINVYKFYNLDDVDTLKKDCFANLYEMITKFDPSKGTKGFSYFNVVCKNWFIHRHREKKKNKIQSSLHHDYNHDSVTNNIEHSVDPMEESIVEKEFWVSLYKDMGTWKKVLKKDTEKRVLEAIVFMMQNPDLVPIYNKKAIYLFLRELTGLNTKQIIINIKKLKVLYEKFKNKFDSDEGIDDEQREKEFNV